MKKIIVKVIAAAIIYILLISPVYAEFDSGAKFKDVKENDWFAEAVVKMNMLKIIDGMPDGSFNPKGEVTRSQFVKMLVQAMKYKKIDSVSFEDLRPFPTSKPHWASVYVETALRNGVIVKDEIGDNFFPDVPLTRKDMAMMMFRALKLELSTGANPFADLTEANGYYTKLYEEYLVRGTPAGDKILFEPEGLTTRAQAAVIISRMLEYKADPAAYKAKMKVEELKTAVGENGVPLRLYEYTEGTKGRTFRECFDEYYYFLRYRGDSYVRTNGYIYPEIATYGGTDAFLKYQVDIVKRYMKYSFNVDYRTVGDNYINGIGDTLGINSKYEAEKNIAEFKKYKVVCKSEFLTDYDLIYKKNGQPETVRGTLRIKFENPTSKEFAKRYGIEVGKWYDLDMDIIFGRNSGNDTWYVYRDNKFEYLSKPILLNK